MAAASKVPDPKQVAEFEKELWGTVGWRPNPGDKITGKVTQLSLGESEYGVYPIVTLGDVAVHAFHTVLRRELNRIRPVVGHTLTIEYHGSTAEGTGKFNKGYEAYTVSSPEYVFDWNMFGRVPKAAPLEDENAPPES